MKLLYLVGMKFGRLTVTARADNTAKGQARWECLCECGKSVVITSQVIRSGKSKSCGCLNLEVLSKRKTTHGHTTNNETSKTYHSWAGMIARCTNPKNSHYPQYGGRGITVCDAWHTFANFLDDMGIKPDGLSLDRINNDLPYAPSNCRWATAIQQARNKSTNRFITYNGITKCVSEWAEFLSVSPSTINWRQHNGYSDSEAIEMSLRNGIYPSDRI